MKRELVEHCKLFREHGTVCGSVKKRRRRCYRSIHEVKNEILKVSIAVC
jgi:hypothetical protein